jgi:hypothetical protein
MARLALAPAFSVTADRLHGCTPWLARLLTLFSYGRCLSVNKPLGHLIVTTRRYWFSRQTRVIGFDRISHIVYRAQVLPSLAPWRYLYGGDRSGWAFFIVALALKDEAEEVQLFTLWQAQPRTADWLDRIAGVDVDKSVGDESARSFIELLTEMTGASISPRSRRKRAEIERKTL